MASKKQNNESVDPEFSGKQAVAVAPPAVKDIQTERKIIINKGLNEKVSQQIANLEAT